MKKTNLIYYPVGCYGTFVEWSCNYFNGSFKSLPFTTTGSSHNYTGNLLHPTEKLRDYINSTQEFELVRCHPIDYDTQRADKYDYFFDLIFDDLVYLEKNFSKILVLYPTDDTKIWIENNVFQKIYFNDEVFKERYEPYGYTKEKLSFMFTDNIMEKFQILLKMYGLETNAQGWQKDNLKDLSKWELRELLSFFWVSQHNDWYHCWLKLQGKFPLVKFISMSELKLFTTNTIKDYLSFFNINFQKKDTEIESIVSDWKLKQIHLNKDQEINKIIQSTINKDFYDWSNSNITFLDEVYIQKLLYDKKIGIRCYELNQFPTDSTQLNTLLYNL